MTDYLFLVVLSFAASGAWDKEQVAVKNVICRSAHCVGTFERDARRSPAVTRFQVFERGRDGINKDSLMPYWRPVIDWSPL